RLSRLSAAHRGRHAAQAASSTSGAPRAALRPARAVVPARGPPRAGYFGSRMYPLASLFPVTHISDLVVADDGRQHAFVCLAALLITFLLIRTSARMTRAFSWW